MVTLGHTHAVNSLWAAQTDHQQKGSFDLLTNTSSFQELSKRKRKVRTTDICIGVVNERPGLLQTGLVTGPGSFWDLTTVRLKYGGFVVSASNLPLLWSNTLSQLLV